MRLLAPILALYTLYISSVLCLTGTAGPFVVQDLTQTPKYKMLVLHEGDEWGYKPSCRFEVGADVFYVGITETPNSDKDAPIVLLNGVLKATAKGQTYVLYVDTASHSLMLAPADEIDFTGEAADKEDLSGIAIVFEDGKLVLDDGDTEMYLSRNVNSMIWSYDTDSSFTFETTSFRLSTDGAVVSAPLALSSIWLGDRVLVAHLGTGFQGAPRTSNNGGFTWIGFTSKLSAVDYPIFYDSAKGLVFALSPQELMVLSADKNGKMKAGPFSETLSSGIDANKIEFWNPGSGQHLWLGADKEALVWTQDRSLFLQVELVPHYLSPLKLEDSGPLMDQSASGTLGKLVPTSGDELAGLEAKLDYLRAMTFPVTDVNLVAKAKAVQELLNLAILAARRGELMKARSAEAPPLSSQEDEEEISGSGNEAAQGGSKEQLNTVSSLSTDN